MPAYNLGELLSQATYSVGRRADIPRSIVSFYANEAYMEVANQVPHALMERIAVSSTTSGENRIELPADFGEPIYFSLLSVNGSVRTLQVAPISQVDSLYQSTSVGIPERYSLFNNWIELWPSPSSAWSLQARYMSVATDMIELDDVPSISTPWRAAILPKLEEKLHLSLGNYSAAALSQQRYLSYINSLPTDEGRRQRGEHPKGVRVAY